MIQTGRPARIQGGHVIVEHAVITVTAGREEEFEAVFPTARAIISTAAGFHWLELSRFVERPSAFLLLVGWDSVEAHLRGFRETDLFPRWRAVIGPFFAEPPVVEHVRAVTGGIGPADSSERRPQS
jgi:heme-degrading monooxygenase HmoA